MRSAAPERVVRGLIPLEIGAILNKRAVLNRPPYSLPRSAWSHCCWSSHRDSTQVDAPLVRHLEVEQVRDLFDVVAVVDAIVSECVTKVTGFLANFRHSSVASKHLARPSCSRGKVSREPAFAVRFRTSLQTGCFAWCMWKVLARLLAKAVHLLDL